MDFLKSLTIAASGLRAQSGRMRVISENIANADSTAQRPGSDRYRREPGHPAADANGNVRYPNVNALVEMTDMREAQRSYEANINVISATRRMIQRTLDILKT
jgi:flagellar basal-body rod protein FlgC